MDDRDARARDYAAALKCCEYALRNLSPRAARDVDFDAMVQCFGDYRLAALAGAEDDSVAVERERCISAIAAYCRDMEAAGKSPRFSDIPAAIRSGEPAR